MKPPEARWCATGDMADRWGWLRPADDFRNLGVTPDFPSTAELARGHVGAGGHEPWTACWPSTPTS